MHTRKIAVTVLMSLPTVAWGVAKLRRDPHEVKVLNEVV
jgi:hypothetical protein